MCLQTYRTVSKVFLQFCSCYWWSQVSFLSSCQCSFCELRNGIAIKPDNIPRKFLLKQLLNLVIVTLPFSSCQAMSRRSPKYKNSKSICYGFEGCSHMVWASQTFLYLPLYSYSSDSQHCSAENCFSCNDSFGIWAMQNRGSTQVCGRKSQQF